MDKEAYEGLLLVVLAAANKKIKAGLRHAASGQYQDYAPGTLELGVALDAVDMMTADIVRFVEENAKEKWTTT